ncbi:MAG: peptidoglycan-binding protein [Planctomycetes bacterium]|nr:peptidoglycan-binding protein [Planctomycetota bacterium]
MPRQSIKRVEETKLPQRQLNANLNKKDVQYLLKQLGYYKGKIDGAHGPVTIRAIKDFQKDNGLVVDGVPGKKTKRKLVEQTRNQYRNQYNSLKN